MSATLRKMIFCLIGLLAGMAAWALSEIVLFFQPSFSSYLLFSISLGGILGAIMGGFLGSTEGIGYSMPSRIRSGILMGTLIGIPGGALGFLAGQGSLFLIGELFTHTQKDFQQIGIPLSRVISWAFLGMFVGSVEGIRSFSARKIQVGLLGGLLGGTLGGIAMESLSLFFPGLAYSRLIGLMVLGAAVGLFYGLVESHFAQGMLKLLNGSLKGKEYLLLQRRTKIGKGKKADIQLADYQGLSDLHATFQTKNGEILLKSLDQKKKVKINEEPILEQVLRLEDVIQIGSAKFLFSYQ